jgi:aldehyde:ferredoxin oxidoreductase
MEVEEGEYKGTKGHKPEYETASAYGSMPLNTNFESIVKANDLCNRYGLDTIGAGAAITFAIECFENGIITLEDTDGIALNWGNHQAIVEMTRKLALRDGFGDVIADGTKKAAERIGKGADKFAVHVGGQDLPMHDPRFQPAIGTAYFVDATPGRHTQGQEAEPPPGLGIKQGDKYDYTGKGKMHRITAALMHVVNSAGVCQFAYGTYPVTYIPDFMTAITGQKWDVDRCIKAGERIGTLRMAFNLREGINPLDWQKGNIGRIIGVPALTKGNNKGVTVDIKTLVEEYFKEMDWDTKTARPSNKRLKELGLEFVVKDI